MTAIIVGSNVVIFGLVPHLAINSERHHYRSTQQTHMLVKMAFFQVPNPIPNPPTPTPTPTPTLTLTL